MLSTKIDQIDSHVFLLNVPLSLSTDQPNNQTMRRLSEQERAIDLGRAISQWQELYGYLAARSIVYLVPSEEGLQDQPFVANLGAVLHHKENLVVVSNFRSEPRVGESQVGTTFFRSLGFETVMAPQYFEGEADLKYLRENIYFGAHGLRTSRNALRWFEEEHEMRVIPIHIYEESLYHLDCVIFPLSQERVILCTDVCDAATLREIEKVADIVDIDFALANRGLTNSARCGNTILCDSPLASLTPTDDLYDVERRKVETLGQIANSEGLDLHVIELSEFYKSGAMLSCMVMNLNHRPLAAAASMRADEAA